MGYFRWQIPILCHYGSGINNGNALRFCIHSFFTICLFKRQEDFQVVLGVQVLKAFFLWH